MNVDCPARTTGMPNDCTCGSPVTRIEWWVIMNIPCTNRRQELRPYPTKRLAKRARRLREHRMISVAWLEERET